jgi:hypothetical protein
MSNWTITARSSLSSLVAGSRLCVGQRYVKPIFEQREPIVLNEILVHLVARHDVIGRVQIAAIDLSARDKAVDFIVRLFSMGLGAASSKLATLGGDSTLGGSGQASAAVALVDAAELDGRTDGSEAWLGSSARAAGARAEQREYHRPGGLLAPSRDRRPLH